MSTNGIDFVIGGKDQAKPAFSSVEKSLERLEKKTEALASSTKMLTTVTGGLAAIYGAVQAVTASLGGISAINAAYDQQADAVKGLETALALQGVAVDAESARLKTFAGEMQKLTGVGDEVTIGLMKQAAMLGVSSAQLDDTAKAAIGLSEATGKSLDESLKLVKNSLEGEFGAFGEIIPAIKTMQTEEEKLAAVLALSQRGLDAKAESSKTVAGMSDRASGAIGDLMESVGALLAPVRVLISAGLQTLAESLQSVLAPSVEYAAGVLENIGPIMDYVKESVIQGVNAAIEAFTFFEVILTNLDSIWAVVVAQAELYMLQLAGAVEHALLVTIPAYAEWFRENFVNLLRDALLLAVTVAENHVKKLIDIFKALWEFIASGGTSDVLGQLGEISGRSYLEGFESSLTDFPEIATRAITSREKELASTIGTIATNLGEEFNTKLQDRIIVAGDGVADAMTKEIDLKIGEKTASELASSGGGGAQSLQASESRLLTRGQSESPVEKTNQLMASMNDLMKATQGMTQEQLAEMRRIAENTSKSVNLVGVT
jgi:hypothetical protein